MLGPTDNNRRGVVMRVARFGETAVCITVPRQCRTMPAIICQTMLNPTWTNKFNRSKTKGKAHNAIAQSSFLKTGLLIIALILMAIAPAPYFLTK